MGDGADLDDDGGEEELQGEDDVDLPDERPAQLGALRHPGVQRPRRRRGGPRLDVAALHLARRWRCLRW